MNDIDIKKIIVIGLAYFITVMAWNIYNLYCPLFLEYLLINKYSVTNTNYIIGIIMSLDNLFAIILIPIIGRISDNTNTKYGKRKPFIIVGLILTAIIFPLIGVMFMYNSIIGLLFIMILLLSIVNIYKSPLVALMPDITPKTHRSKANGILNLIGYSGSIFSGVLIVIFGVSNVGSYSYLYPFLITSLLCLVIVYITSRHIKEYKKKNNISADMINVKKNEVKINKLNILLFILFWNISYNAVETFLSLYTIDILGGNISSGSILIIMTTSTLLFFIPSTLLINKYGLKVTTLFGVIIMLLSFFLMSIISFYPNVIVIIILFVLVGISYSILLITSYPLLISNINDNDNGVYTSQYFKYTMIAQSISPILVGTIMSLCKLNRLLLFPFSTLTMIITLFIVLSIKENHRISIKHKSLLENFDIED